MREMTRDLGAIGEVRHYTNRIYGFGTWQCTCGELVRIKFSQKKYVRKDDDPVIVEFEHRNRTRKYTAKKSHGWRY
jgi:hypothetical protein